MAERSRVFTGTLPETGQQVLVTIFEEVPQGPTAAHPRIVGMEVATREGEGRFARWGTPATMTEEN